MLTFLRNLSPFAYASITSIASMWTLTMFMSISRDIQLSVILFVSFLIGSLAYRIASSIKSRSYDRVIKCPDLDVYNRKYFLDVTGREISKSIRKQSSLRVIAFKLDHYSDIKCKSPKSLKIILEQMCIHINRNIRNNDVFARIDRNTFMLLLSEGTSKDNAKMLSERIEGIVGSITTTTKDQTFSGLTCTILDEEFNMDEDVNSELFVQRLEQRLDHL